VGHTIGADSETGALRAVVVHRPGTELKRITPRTASRLLLDTRPWLTRAQQEHDAFTQVLRDRGAEVLYLTELLQDVLEYQSARDDAICSVLADAGLGDELRSLLRGYLEGLTPETLAQVLITGLTQDQLGTGHGLVYELLSPHDFVIEPLPNLIFCRDASAWIGDRVAVASLAPPRRREADLARIVYCHHPRFAGTEHLYHPGLEPVDGADLLLLGPGALAIGVGSRTSPAGVERLARQVLDSGIAQTVLAVPVGQRGAGGQLDTLCTVVDSGTVLMYPAAAFTLIARTITARPDGLRVSRPQPFIEAAAQALGIDRLTIIDTGLEPAAGPGGEWDDSGNVLALGGGVVVCHERTVETNARLEAAGLQVIEVPCSELGSSRGGPRSLCCPVSRDPAGTAAGQRAQLPASAADGGQPAAAVIRQPGAAADQRHRDRVGAGV
jgi:arginine deiminase